MEYTIWNSYVCGAGVAATWELTHTGIHTHCLSLYLAHAIQKIFVCGGICVYAY